MKKAAQEKTLKRLPSETKFRATPRVKLGDARYLSKKLHSESIDVTITSPPYFDLKDYGVHGQIGFGQSYETYLSDLQKVFTEVLRATKPVNSRAMLTPFSL